jgi:hypothetical protein
MAIHCICPCACAEFRAARCVLLVSFIGSTMTQRAHFWLRIVGISVILAAQFGPRLWSAAASGSPAPVAAAAVAR